MNNLTHALCAKVKFTLNEVEDILERFKKASMKKDFILLKENEVCNTLWFIDSGCLALVSNLKKQNRIIQVFTGNYFAIDICSYLQQQPQNLMIQCLSDCELMLLSKKDLDELYLTMPNWKRFMNRCLEEVCLSYISEMLYIKTCSNDERYFKLQDEQPELFQQLPLRTIANYLGMTAVGLSKLRGRVHKHAKAAKALNSLQEW